MKKENTEMALFLFTANYPYGNGESFIETELMVLSSYFSNIYIFPLSYSGNTRTIPSNTEVVNWQSGFKYNGIKTLLKYPFTFLRIFFYEFLKSSQKVLFLKQLGEVKSLLLQNIARADQIREYIDQNKKNNSIFYTFWFNDWASVLGIFQQRKIISQYFTRTHGFDLYSERRKKRYIPFRNFQMKTVKSVYAVSKDGFKYLNKKFPQYTSKIKLNHLGVLDNGVNPFIYNNVLTIVSCSNLISLKRVHLIVAILKNVKANVQWIHFGDGPLKQRILEMTKQLRDNITVDFKGQMANNEILSFYQKNTVHLMILLSETEGGVPISLQEAASFGIPLLGTNVGGIPEIVTEETGILIPVGVDIEETAQLIDEFGLSFRNTVEFRMQCREFWKRAFDARKNYEIFCKQLMGLT